MSKDKTYRRLIASPRWRAVRCAYLSAHPVCEMCAARTPPRYRAAQCVHHRTECETARTEAQMEQLMFTPSNLQALCYECHADIHRAKRSHSRQAVVQRRAEALERWKAAHARPPGVLLDSDPLTSPKSTPSPRS